MGNCVQADQHVSSPLDGNGTDVTQNMDLLIAQSESDGWSSYNLSLNCTGTSQTPRRILSEITTILKDKN